MTRRPHPFLPLMALPALFAACDEVDNKLGLPPGGTHVAGNPPGNNGGYSDDEYYDFDLPDDLAVSVYAWCVRSLDCEPDYADPNDCYDVQGYDVALMLEYAAELGPGCYESTLAWVNCFNNVDPCSDDFGCYDEYYGYLDACGFGTPYGYEE